jgi:hypothetical protein
MSNRKLTETTVKISERALKTFGLETSLIALEVACDLRNGAIKPEEYNQGSFCGSSCCIWGHIHSRLYIENSNIVGRINTAGDLTNKDNALFDLFGGGNPSDPMLAADAIEAYVLHGADRPWNETGSKVWR